jgi:hypothetical protein
VQGKHTVVEKAKMVGGKIKTIFNRVISLDGKFKRTAYVFEMIPLSEIFI